MNFFVKAQRGGSQNFKLQWVGIDEALTLFESAQPQTEFHRNMNERDKGFLLDARTELEAQ